MSTKDLIKNAGPASPFVPVRRLPVALFSLLIVAFVSIGGCATKPESAAITQAERPAMQSAEGSQRTSGGMVGTPLPPEVLQPTTVQAAPPPFPRQPDWNSTFWDISSP